MKTNYNGITIENCRFTTRIFEHRYIELGVKVTFPSGNIYYASECTTKDIEELCPWVCWKDYTDEKNEDSVWSKISEKFSTYTIEDDEVKEYNGEMYCSFLDFADTFAEYNN